MKESAQEVIDFIRCRLGLPESEEASGLNDPYEFFSTDLPLRPDFISRKGNALYFVEIKYSPVTIDTIARMQLLRDLWYHRYSKHMEIRPVIAAKTIHRREEGLAEELGIEIVKLPWSLHSQSSSEYKSTKTRITSPKSWKIVSRLLKEKTSSIRQLALKEEVSYGWAYRVIQQLSEQKIVQIKNNYVRLDDPKPLLNGVAWERPMKNLQIDELQVDLPGALSAAQEITWALREQEIPFAFTCYTAGGLYTGYAVRQDAVYLYVKKEAVKQFREQLGSNDGTGIQVKLYAPDRDVFSDVREKECVQVVSPAQTLLDLAGLGYSAMDLTRAMVETYAIL